MNGKSRELGRVMSSVGQAFILGAGLGTRLRPLTESLPKPLVPIWNRPLITFAFDHLKSELGVREFMVNTHHCSEGYAQAFPEGTYQGCPLSFRHETVLLDTAGGIDNVRDWLPEDQSFVVYNGDILTDLPLKGAWEHHLRSENLVTLVLRSRGDELRVGFDEESGEVVDLRGQLRPDWSKRYQFTGIYFVSPAFLKYIRPGEIESVVLSFLEAIRNGEKIGGFLADDGEWSDLGARPSYLDALRLPLNNFPAYAGAGTLDRVSASARVPDSAKIDEFSILGRHVTIGEGATVRESILWDGATVAAGASLNRVVVRGGQVAEGALESTDL